MRRRGIRQIMMVGGFMLLTSNGVLANISVEGHYQGKNLIVQSPESEDGFGYCVNKITVNGEIASSSVQSSAFQIDLTEFNISIGDPVIVVLEHEEGCKPKLINPEVLLPKSTFVLKDISCTPDGELTWKTTNENGALDYQIEQYKWNKWIVIGEVSGEGDGDLNEYLFQISPHSGENKIRVTQTDMTGKKRISKEVVFECSSCEEPILKERNKVLIFESPSGKGVRTKYEIFDAYGNIVKKGMNSMVDLSNLKKGVYHVNYDKKYEKIIIR